MRTNKGFLELRRLEAARDIANVLATSGNRVMLDSQSLLLNGKQIDIYNWSRAGPEAHATNAVAGSDAKEILKIKK
jgi:prohibitin 2